MGAGSIYRSWLFVLEYRNNVRNVPSLTAIQQGQMSTLLFLRSAILCACPASAARSSLSGDMWHV